MDECEKACNDKDTPMDAPTHPTKTLFTFEQRPRSTGKSPRDRGFDRKIWEHHPSMRGFPLPRFWLSIYRFRSIPSNSAWGSCGGWQQESCESFTLCRLVRVGHRWVIVISVADLSSCQSSSRSKSFTSWAKSHSNPIIKLI